VLCVWQMCDTMSAVCVTNVWQNECCVCDKRVTKWVLCVWQMWNACRYDFHGCGSRIKQPTLMANQKVNQRLIKG
jgi:hypothetical protein